MAANGQGTYTPHGIGVASTGQSGNGLTPYTQYTEPGYRPPQYSQPSSPTRTEQYQQPNAFLYGNNGSAGSLGGSLQGGSFYQSEPSSLTQGDTRSSLGQAQPYNPGIQALQMSRSR